MLLVQRHAFVTELSPLKKVCQLREVIFARASPKRYGNICDTLALGTGIS